MRVSLQRPECQRDAHEGSQTSSAVQEEGQSRFGRGREALFASEEDARGENETCGEFYVQFS